MQWIVLADVYNSLVLWLLIDSVLHASFSNASVVHWTGVGDITLITRDVEVHVYQ